jgi:hypothetical protein
MSSASVTATPSDELASRRAWTGATLANGVLTGDIARFCQSGLAVVMASCDSDSRPVVGRGLACRIDQAGKVRLVLRADSNRELLLAIARSGTIAVTFTQPSTHRSLQLKARGARTTETEPTDGRLAELQTAAFKAELIEDGYWEDFAERYCAFDAGRLAAIEFVPEQAFVQTPGPGAGSPLQP